MKIGTYTLHLYCDNQTHIDDPWNPKWKDSWGPYGSTESPGSTPSQYIGKNYARCHRQAIKDGWSITKKRQLCPVCNPRRKK